MSYSQGHGSGDTARRPAVSSATATPAAKLAERYGLTPSSARPPLRGYIKQLWQRRHFIVSFATSKTITQYSGARLGQVWQVLTPLLNASVYFLIFGVLFNARHDVKNYTAFLLTGVFVFTFTQRSVNSGARAIGGNLGLIRALHFPRACLPLAYTLVELQQLAISMGVLCVLVVLAPPHEPVTWSWLLLIPALLMQTMFNVGISMVIARIGAFAQDINQLLPFILRTWLYLSGVFFSIPQRMEGAPDWVREVMEANPGAVFIELVRDAVISSHPAHSKFWILGIVWAIVGLCVGFWYFWSAEEKYGRG
ncbi:ABC transporter permease [Flindersiella endophytica]